MRLVVPLIVILHVMPLWAMIPVPIAEVPVTKKIAVEGYVVVASGWQWNGKQFQVNIVPNLDYTIYDESLAKLVFATDREYREAVRNNGFIVRVEGTEVARGSDSLLVVESIRTVAK